MERLSGDPWNLGNLDIPAILTARGHQWRPLSDHARVLIGDLTGMDAVFVLSAPRSEELALEPELLFPYAYRGAEVRSFEACEPTAVVIYPYVCGPDNRAQLIPEQTLVECYPRVHAYLATHKTELRRRMDTRKLYANGDEWYRHLRPGTYDHILPNKLIVKGISTRSVVGRLAAGSIFNGANCPGIIPNNDSQPMADYLLGLLNSKVVSFYLRAICPPKLGGYSRFNARSIASTPVLATGDEAVADQVSRVAAAARCLVSLADEAKSARMSGDREGLKRSAGTVEYQLNQAVYELYGLTDDEIAIIESSFDKE